MRMSCLFAFLSLLVLSISCSTPQSTMIIGKWQSTAVPGDSLEFLKDGTFIAGNGASADIGTYKIIDDKRVRTDIPGVGGWLGTKIFDVTVSGDDLTIKFEAGEGPTGTQYKRVR